MKRRPWLVLLVLPVVGGCFGGPSVKRSRLAPAEVAPPEMWKGVRCIAVLPPDNWTTDTKMEYKTWYRAAIMTLLKERGWRCSSIPRINRALNKWGFNLAGEVSQFTGEELCTEFGCDAIMSWAIVKASGNNVVLNISVHNREGKVLWATGERRLRIPYNVVDSHLRAQDRWISMALAQALRDFPEPK
jgi:hypothetical protein